MNRQLPPTAASRRDGSEGKQTGALDSPLSTARIANNEAPASRPTTGPRAEYADRPLSEVINYAIRAHRESMDVARIFCVTPTDATGYLTRFVMDAILFYRPDVQDAAPTRPITARASLDPNGPAMPATTKVRAVPGWRVARLDGASPRGRILVGMEGEGSVVLHADAPDPTQTLLYRYFDQLVSLE